MSRSPQVTLQWVDWDDPDAVALRSAQQAELAALYDGVEDIEPVLPPDEMLATVLVRADGVVAGCGSLRTAPALGAGVGELKRMYVLPALRGRGLSRAILTALEEVAVGTGLRRLVLETGLRQPGAIGLYRSAGYEPIPNYGVYAGEPTSVCLARSLPGHRPAAGR